ncbi:hypothetical protein DVS28_b0211 (plasmid) [Euzebya pacifica]|uniref:Uncharacterized protein n=1 Tax=Euzebya pacifica TaxID=1608957 RepID=A0A346Y684_9ACTN|nr:hypothetical protein DVS28_b0211 [Euzebya pacifica]
MGAAVGCDPDRISNIGGGGKRRLWRPVGSDRAHNGIAVGWGRVVGRRDIWGRVGRCRTPAFNRDDRAPVHPGVAGQRVDDGRGDAELAVEPLQGPTSSPVDAGQQFVGGHTEGPGGRHERVALHDR